MQSGLTQLLRWADDERVRLDDLRARSASLESVFLEIAEGRREDERTDDSASPADVRHPEPMGTRR